MRPFPLAAIAVGLMTLQTAPVSAATIINGSFESGLADIGGYTTVAGGNSTSITGWTVLGNSVDYIGSYWTAEQGSRSLDLSGNAAGGVSTMISGLLVDHTYNVSFWMAGNPAGAPADKTLSVKIGDGDPQQYTFNVSGKSLGSMGWILESFIFTAAGTSQLLSFNSLTNSSWGPALDNVSISETPLPPALLLFGSALGLLGWLKRQKPKVSEAPWMMMSAKA